MHLPEEPVREREPAPQALQPVFEGGHAVRDLGDIVERNAGPFLRFEEQEVGER